MRSYYFLISLFIHLNLFAEIKTAKMNFFSSSFFLHPTTNPAGNTIHYHSYDFSTVKPQLTNLGGYNGEAKPITLGSNEYYVDFIELNPRGTIVSWGNSILTLPSTDEDSNGVIDFLQKDKDVNVEVSFLEKFHFNAEGYYSTNQYVLNLTRSAGDSLGSFKILEYNGNSNSSQVGHFYLNSWNTEALYDQSNQSVSFSASQNDTIGNLQSLTGGMNYHFTNASKTLHFTDFTLSASTGTKLDVEEIELELKNGKYFGSFSYEDGNPATTIKDYVNWYVEIADNNDYDKDGLPDFSDPNIIESTQLVLDEGGWTWNGAFPWVYNSDTQSWYYYYFTDSSYNLYDARTGKWYTFDSSSKRWLAK
jgi:hypothetical protein